MARKHAFLIALVLGLAAALGALAAIDTARLTRPQAAGADAPAQSAQLQRRGRLLDRQAVSLRRALSQRPPKLPRVPVFARVGTPSSAPGPTAVAAPAPRVQFVRPAPVIVIKHRSHENEAEDDGGGGDD